MTEQTRKGFHAEIDEISDLIVQLAARAGDAVARATDALLKYDLVEAQQIIDDDDYIDVAAIEVEEKCQSLLALQQPMAGDLRQILAAMWITGELERTGGLACNICKGARRMFRTELPPRLRGLIAEMNEEAIRLIRLSVDSYSERDAALASALHDIDDRLDSLHRTFVKTLLESSRTHDLDVQPSMQLALIARYYERIGDHAVNISDRVRYMVSGVMPWRAGLARHRARDEPRTHELAAESAETSSNGDDKAD
ncbi:MAG: phosphate signaling complex protein PhoU [Acidimicrobiaceae bacterium]|nr:phosphate signaling complex protein PhoU [Acidimicrobiaceae bacterium]MYB87383.1 phosphate signaling complex protein PhoU [Acidimicrobiaceae bacterium]MYH94701.1 phosphate signaling complex protein PhoU [Acidimicrobiaceae bacterium]